MIPRFSFLSPDSTRVHAIADTDEAVLGLSSGGMRVVLVMSEPVARAVRTELDNALPAGAPITLRPRAPTVQNGRPINWRALLLRVQAGKPLPGDADALAFHLSYFGVSIT